MPALLVRTFVPEVPPTLVVVAGDVDLATVRVLRWYLRSVPDRATVLDLSGVPLLSAAGLTALLDLRDRLARADARLAIAAAPRLVRRVLAITELDDALMLAETVDDAVRELTTPSAAARPGPRSSTAARFCQVHRLHPRR
jgi:anti-anti-sigma factor